MNKNVFLISLILGIFLSFSFSSALAKDTTAAGRMQELAALDEKGEFLGVACGQTTNGQTQYCSKNQKCYKCTWRERYWYTLWTAASENSDFRCYAENSSSIPSECKYTARGGQTGDSHDEFLFWDYNEDSGKQCIVENFMRSYVRCYGCAIVETLASAFVKAGSSGYGVSRQAGNVILIVGTMLWLAFFALKNVSSFATIEPMKMLQDLFIQLFKIIVALVVLNSGIQTILSYTVVPLMNAGTDFGDAILNTVTAEDLHTDQAYKGMNLVGQNKSSEMSEEEQIRRSEGGGGQTSRGGGSGAAGGGHGGGTR